MTNFSSLGLSRPICDALEARGLTTPTPIQSQAIPALLTGRDVLGLAQTGSGKTAAFGLPLIERIAAAPAAPVKGTTRGLILAPTRELAAQCLDQIKLFGRGLEIRSGLAIGGVSIHKQKADARRGFDVLVATPGRLVDLMDQGALSLRRVEYFVLDEVDQMLDLGFIKTIRSIANLLPEKRQNVFFSATMSKPIEKLARAFLVDPAEVRIAAGPKPKIAERVIHLTPAEKVARLVAIVQGDDFESGLIFTRTKRGADRVAKSLNAVGLEAHPIHGNRSQPQRERALAAFKSGRSRLLVATDIAARGIDVAGVSHVVNFDLPATPETYVHRIGRTGRAGASGTAVSFCGNEEAPQLRAIERLTGKAIPTLGEAPTARIAANDHAPLKKRPRRRNKPKAGAAPKQRQGQSAGQQPQVKEAANGERGTSRIRRRRNRSAAGRQLQGTA